MNPLQALIERNLRGIGSIVCFASGKGGVGKSILSSACALLLARNGKRVGLLDLDLHGPSIPHILGLSLSPVEDRGILPPEHRGVKVLSLEFFTKGACPMLGTEIQETLGEIFSITRWGELDHLLVDLPPGMGEELLEILGFGPKFLVITTPSSLAWHTARKLLDLLLRSGAEVLGVVENMVSGEPSTKTEVERMGLKHVSIGFDPQVEERMGGDFPPPGLSRDVEKMIREMGI